jgi:hypothetical protein
MKDEYIKDIIGMVQTCDDILLLEVIFRLLVTHPLQS